MHLTSTLSYSLYVINYRINKAIIHRFEKFEDVIKEISLKRECTDCMTDIRQLNSRQVHDCSTFCNHRVE